MQRLRCDKGGEYTAGYFRELRRQTGIEHECGATNTPQQNGMSERDDRAHHEHCVLHTNQYRHARLPMGRYLWNRGPHHSLFPPLSAWRKAP